MEDYILARPASKDKELELLKMTVQMMRIQIEHQRRAINVLLERQGMSWPRQVREDELEKNAKQ